MEKVGSLECTEEEDDTNKKADDDRGPVLEGDWHQLQGVPRPGDFLGSRFLAWTGRGHVAVFPSEGRMEVARDESVQRSRDSLGMKMAAMSTGATVGASSEPGAQVFIWPVERWEKATFSATLGSSEEIVEAVTSGDTFVAALTSTRLLRIFGLSGLPLGVVATAGRSVALAARGDRLLVVTGAPGCGHPAKGEDDALEFRLLDVSLRSQVAAGRLPLSPGSRLRWIGFSSELVPLAIDSHGLVRALFAAGAGTWGPATGGGGEWTVVLQLAAEEIRLGPLWAVDARQSVLIVAEVGAEALEPRPFKESEGSALQKAVAAADAAEAGWDAAEIAPPLRFGHGAQLRELCWQLPLGPLLSCGPVAETALRESLVAQHLTEVVAAQRLPAAEGNRVLAVATGARLKAALTLYAQFVKNEEQERAFDAAAHLLAVAGGSKQLSNAQAIAEKARMHKLADKISALPRLRAVTLASSDPPAPGAPASASVADAVAAVPKVVRKEVAPLFEPGEGEAHQTPSTGPVAPAVELITPRGSGDLSEDAAAVRRPASGVAVVDLLTQASQPEPARPESELAAFADANHQRNPFARRQGKQRPQIPARAPNLLRAAVGGGTKRPADRSEEPPLKVSRVAVTA